MAALGSLLDLHPGASGGGIVHFVSPIAAVQTEFERDGYFVLRGALTEAEVDRLATPIRSAFAKGEYDGHDPEKAYPTPGIYSMGPAILGQHPEIASSSLAHPSIVNAIEELFGEPAVLAQYWSIMRPPGAGVGENPYVPGEGAHFDYKPWRCVGSFVKWMFAVIPFVDYTPEAGPLCVAPGSYHKTKVLSSDGRVHPVDAAQVPPPAEIELVDPSLVKGDVVLMHGFCWHEARPNYGTTDRSGLYMKFHAVSSPPACGPWIYPSAVHDALSPEMKHLVPYHRADGQVASVRGKPVGGIDEAQVVIEDAAGHILLVGDDDGGWTLPRCTAAEDAEAGILDTCNVMGSVMASVEKDLGLQLPWLSWLLDLPEETPDGTTRCRVYGHRLLETTPDVATQQGRWMSLAEVESASITSRDAIARWVRMWQQQEDEHGRPVTRSFGVPSTHVRHFRYNFRGNPPGTYRVGEFGEDGLPIPAPAAVG